MKIEVYATRFSSEIRFVGPDMGAGDIGNVECVSRFPYLAMSATGFTRAGILSGGDEFWSDAERVAGWRLTNAYEAAGGKAEVEKQLLSVVAK